DIQNYDLGIKWLKILAPETIEQQRIAEFLDRKCAELDAVIEKTNTSIVEFKKLKRSVITEAVTKGVWKNRAMKNSGIEWIGEIPDGWNVTGIGRFVSKIGSGKTPSGGAETYANEGILFLRSQNIYDTGLSIDNPTFITEAVDEEMRGSRVQPYDVLLNITGGSIGRCCIFYPEYGRANVNQHVCIIRTIPDKLMPEFLHYYWISSLGQTAISLYQTGGNREGMSSNAISKSPIPLPTISEQKEIVAFLDLKCTEIDKLIAKKEQYIVELESFKKSLIYEYVTGKKEVLV
ncbi:MAG: restriction endonuclease subunit S, partial [Bacteroidales bacterium]|nr:restriction endonuclease subunit S [Bacteroidales bacterium]